MITQNFYCIPCSHTCTIIFFINLARSYCQLVSPFSLRICIFIPRCYRPWSIKNYVSHQKKIECSFLAEDEPLAIFTVQIYIFLSFCVLIDAGLSPSSFASIIFFLSPSFTLIHVPTKPCTNNFTSSDQRGKAWLQ